MVPLPGWEDQRALWWRLLWKHTWESSRTKETTIIPIFCCLWRDVKCWISFKNEWQTHQLGVKGQCKGNQGRMCAVLRIVFICEIPWQLQTQHHSTNQPPTQNLKVSAHSALRILWHTLKLQPWPLLCFYGSIFPTWNTNKFATRYYGGKGLIQLCDLINSNG